MAKKKVKPEEVIITPPEDVLSQNGFSSEEAKSLCGFSHIRYIMIQEMVKGKTKTFTYPIKEAAAPLRHANKYLLGNQRVIVPGMDGDDNLQYKYSYVGDNVQIHVFWATKKPKLCDKN
jgi:hypothetical protein